MKKITWKKAVQYVFEGLVCVALACLFVVFIMTKMAGQPIFIAGKTTMWVMTESMSPTISPKTYILVEKATADDVEVGDIVVFVSTDPRIAGQNHPHRIIEKNGDKIVTKGDHNSADDGAYSAQADKIVGRYVKTLPVMTFLGRMVMSPVGFVVVMILFVLTTVLCVLPNVKEALEEKKKEDEEAKQKEMERLVREEVERMEKEGVQVSDLKKIQAEGEKKE